MADTKTKMYEVVDSSCTSQYPSRIHDINIEGKIKQVKFAYGDKTLLPFAEAMKFQRDGFEVLDDKGAAMPRAADTPMEIAVRLAPDQVIARLSELTADALYARAVTLPGGEKFKANTSKDTLIGFLAEAAKAKTEPSASEEITEMSSDELDGMGVSES